MPVNPVHTMGWTRKSATVSVLMVMEEHRRQAGVRVLALRTARRWTHEDLAHAAGVSVKTVSRFEAGRNEGRRTTIRKLAKALGVEETEIIGSPPAAQVSQLDRIEHKLDMLLANAGIDVEPLEAIVSRGMDEFGAPEPTSPAARPSAAKHRPQGHRAA